MLILERRVNEKIYLEYADGRLSLTITLVITKIHNNSVEIGFKAPDDVVITRNASTVTITRDDCKHIPSLGKSLILERENL